LNILNIRKIFVVLTDFFPFKTTDKFVDATMLFSFLLIIFFQTGNLKFELNAATKILLVILFFIIGESAGKNITQLRKLLNRSESKKDFLRNVKNMTDKEAIEEMKRKTFNSEDIDYFIKLLQEDNSFSPKFVYSFIDWQGITTKNLEKLLSSNTIVHLYSDTICLILYKKCNCLKRNQLFSIFEHFQEQEEVIKMLFSTQKYSYLLLESEPKNNFLSKYYTKYQLNKTHMDKFLKYFPVEKIQTIGNIIFWIIFIIFIVLGTYSFKLSNVLMEREDLLSLLFGAFLISFFVRYLFYYKIHNFAYEFRYKRFLRNVIES
jgi:hypothetical protein